MDGGGGRAGPGGDGGGAPRPDEYARSLVPPQSLQELCYGAGACNSAWSFLQRAVHMSNAYGTVDIVDDDKLATYASMYSNCLKLSTFLASACNVGLESRVAVMMPNCAEVMELHFTAAATNATLLNLNTHLVAQELAYILGDARPVVIFSSIAYARTLEEALRAVVGEHAAGRGQPLSVRSVVWVVLGGGIHGIGAGGGAVSEQQAQELERTEQAMRRVHGLGLKQYSYHSIINRTVEYDFRASACLPSWTSTCG